MQPTQLNSTTSRSFDHFPILILIGRPASGKSEIIDYLVHLSDRERLDRFHLRELYVLDDFPMLWTWYEEDFILAKEMHQERLHTDEDGYFKYEYLWHLLIRRLSLEFSKRLRDNPDHLNLYSTIIEFSRGSEHGGYAQAFNHLPETILTIAVVLYVNVSFEESLRKNRKRFNPAKPDSILEHGLPDEKMERLYREDDWETFCSEDANWLNVKGVELARVTFENEDDVTSGKPEPLGLRLEETLNRLWQLERERL